MLHGLSVILFDYAGNFFFFGWLMLSFNFKKFLTYVFCKTVLYKVSLQLYFKTVTPSRVAFQIRFSICELRAAEVCHKKREPL